MPLRKKKDNKNSEKGKSMLRKIREDLVKCEIVALSLSRKTRVMHRD